MNPGIGAPELLVIAIIALVVVGPKDLPLMVRRVGRFVGKMRGLAREFQRSFDELGREAELEELKKEVEQLKKANPVSEIQKEFRQAEADAIRAGAEDRPHPRAAKDKAASSAPLKGEPLKFGPAAEAGDPAPDAEEMTGPRARPDGAGEDRPAGPDASEPRKKTG